MSVTIQDSEILEKVFLTKDYKLTDEANADFIRIRLKDGRTLYGYKNKRPGTRVILQTEKDFHNANKRI
jgi:hypothetical protein